MSTLASEAQAKRQQLEAATYTVADLATLLGVSERHIHRMRDLKQIPGELRFGKAVRFAKAIIDKWLSTGVIPVTR